MSKNGIAAPPSHPLRAAVERHRNRLKAEFTKARVRRSCPSVEELKELAIRTKRSQGYALNPQPRWVRINNVITSLDKELDTSFPTCRRTSSLDELTNSGGEVYYKDNTIPDLLAIPQSAVITSSAAYSNGSLILQDKASCFPAHLLLGDQAHSWEGDIIDACAAPGNKTTHLASLLCSRPGESRPVRIPNTIFSLDASQSRSKTLQHMVHLAGADEFVKVLAGQDFLALSPQDKRVKNVKALLLDPSCSGSGIVGRDDTPSLALPISQKTVHVNGKSRNQNKKRKREDPNSTISTDETSHVNSDSSSTSEIDVERLTKLSNLQLRIIEHAFSFPSATRVTYSTCSTHAIENENVVYRALNSSIAKQRGWKILPRSQQVKGLREWKHRGIVNDKSQVGHQMGQLSEEEREACLRCWPGQDEGTGGFFVVGFTRTDSSENKEETIVSEGTSSVVDIGSVGQTDDDEESWGGFDD